MHCNDMFVVAIGDALGAYMGVCRPNDQETWTYGSGCII
jgi:hypothetical protein